MPYFLLRKPARARLVLDFFKKLDYYSNVWPQFVLVMGFVLLLYLTAPPWAAAHGGGTPQLVNVEIGPYWISTWISPDPPAVDDFHLTIGLSEPTDPNATIREAGPPILNATIEVQLQSTADPTLVVVEMATHDQAENKFLYEADVNVPKPGEWQGQITVTGPDSGTGTVSFVVDVVAGNQFSMAWLVSGAIVLVVIIGWALRRVSGSRP